MAYLHSEAASRRVTTFEGMCATCHSCFNVVVVVGQKLSLFSVSMSWPHEGNGVCVTLCLHLALAQLWPHFSKVSKQKNGAMSNYVPSALCSF